MVPPSRLHWPAGENFGAPGGEKVMMRVLERRERWGGKETEARKGREGGNCKIRIYRIYYYLLHKVFLKKIVIFAFDGGVEFLGCQCKKINKKINKQKM